MLRKFWMIISRFARLLRTAKRNEKNFQMHLLPKKSKIDLAVMKPWQLLARTMDLRRPVGIVIITYSILL